MHPAATLEPASERHDTFAHGRPLGQPGSGVLAPILVRLRRLAIARARDITTEVTSRPALVLAPHPDDETLGCGGVILRKLAAGTPVTVVVVADGRHSHRSPAIPPERLRDLRAAEMDECARRLGLPADAVRQLGFEDQTLEHHEDELVEIIAKLVAELEPAEVYVTGQFESHRDHAALGRAARRALRRRGVAPALMEYPIWLWTQLWYGSDEPLSRRIRTAAAGAAVVLQLRRAVAVSTHGTSARKLHALAAHASQLARPARVPDPDPWPVLPPVLLDAAADRVEIFLRWRGRRLPGILTRGVTSRGGNAWPSRDRNSTPQYPR